MNTTDHKNSVSSGWATRDVTPDREVILGAQFKMRVSEGVDSPVTVTALALSTGDAPDDAVIFVSCDRGGFRHKWYDENDFLPLCREAIRARSSEIDPDTVILNATHTHTAPMTLVNQFGPEAEVLPDGVMIDKKSLFKRHGHPPAGTGLKERIDVARGSKLSRRRQVRIRVRGTPYLTPPAG